MDFTKFISMIDSQQLHLTRCDKFKDPYEGTYPTFNIQQRAQNYNFKNDIEALKFNIILEDANKLLRKSTFINCWHQNEYESAAMWDLYSKTNESIAIETTYNKLANILPIYTYIGLVDYIDYLSESIPENNIYNLFMHKRKSFEHEKEVRIIFSHNKVDANGELAESDKENIEIPIVFNKLINNIHINPNAPMWFKELVISICKKYDIKVNVTQSNLYKAPKLY